MLGVLSGFAIAKWLGTFYLANKKYEGLKEERKTELAKAVAEGRDLLAEEAAANRKALDVPSPTDVLLLCPLGKSGRRACRKKLIKRGKSGNKEQQDAADRLSREMDDIERARLAKYIYLSPEEKVLLKDPRGLQAPEGFTPANADDLERMGLTANDLSVSPEELKLAVYKYDTKIWGLKYKDRFAVVARGTTISLADWIANIKNGTLQSTEYYKKATLVGRKIALSGMAGKVDAIGHSLGGGLAQAISAGSRGLMKVTTFNSAGVNLAGLWNYMLSPDSGMLFPKFDDAMITSYRVLRELLTYEQESGPLSSFMADAHGTKFDLEPRDPKFRRDDIEDKDRAELHSMNLTIDAMEYSKERDEALLLAIPKSKSKPKPAPP